MAISQFSNPNLQRVYESGVARLGEIERQKRAMATGAAARSGVKTSGVSMIPQGEISRGAVMAESQLGSDVAMQAEEERLQAERFEQQRQLQQEQASLMEAADARRAELERKQGRSQIGGQIIGGVIGAGANALADRYLGPARRVLPGY